jgi:hypothetical protein
MRGLSHNFVVTAGHRLFCMGTIFGAIQKSNISNERLFPVLPDSRSRPSHGSASRSANGAEFSRNTTGPPIQRESEWATTSAKLVKNCRGHSLHQTMLDKPLFCTTRKTTREENNNVSRKKKKSDDTRKNIAICSVNVFQFHFFPR